MAPKKAAAAAEPEPEPEPEEPPEPEEGEGIFYFPDNSKYGARSTACERLAVLVRSLHARSRVAEGLWLMKDGVKMRHGKGMFVEGVPEGSAPQSYEGEWREDAMHGHGTFRYASNAKYVVCYDTCELAPPTAQAVGVCLRALTPQPSHATG